MVSINECVENENRMSFGVYVGFFSFNVGVSCFFTCFPQVYVKFFLYDCHVSLKTCYYLNLSFQPPCLFQSSGSKLWHTISEIFPRHH